MRSGNCSKAKGITTLACSHRAMILHQGVSADALHESDPQQQVIRMQASRTSPLCSHTGAYLPEGIDSTHDWSGQLFGIRSSLLPRLSADVEPVILRATKESESPDLWPGFPLSVRIPVTRDYTSDSVVKLLDHIAASFVRKHGPRVLNSVSTCGIIVL